MEKRDKQTKGKPYKIVVCGPESSAKSSITELLADYFGCGFSSEYLREFAEERYARGEKLSYGDNLKIAAGQIEAEKQAEKKSSGNLYICDTDLLQTMVYSEIYYSDVQPELRDFFLKRKGDFYLLMSPDIEWEYDIVRDSSVDRAKVYALLLSYLKKYNLPYAEINGLGEERFENAKKSLLKFIEL